MIRSMLVSLLFILTNSVMAQASVLPRDLGIARIEPNTWITTHATQIQLDGLPVVAALEAIENQVEVPNFMAEKIQTLVPLAPTKKIAYRMVFISTENPDLRASFPLKGQNVSVDGQIRYAYVSASQDRDFTFLVTSQNDGSLNVKFTRAVGTPNLTQGEFTLAPLAHALQN